MLSAGLISQYRELQSLNFKFPHLVDEDEDVFLPMPHDCQMQITRQKSIRGFYEFD